MNVINIGEKKIVLGVMKVEHALNFAINDPDDPDDVEMVADGAGERTKSDDADWMYLHLCSMRADWIWNWIFCEAE
jgi:hypothetical protein